MIFSSLPTLFEAVQFLLSDLHTTSKPCSSLAAQQLSSAFLSGNGSPRDDEKQILGSTRVEPE